MVFNSCVHKPQLPIRSVTKEKEKIKPPRKQHQEVEEYAIYCVEAFGTEIMECNNPWGKLY